MGKELTPLEIINIKLKDKNNKYDRRVINGSGEYLYLIKEEELNAIESALEQKGVLEYRNYNLGNMYRALREEHLALLEFLKGERQNAFEEYLVNSQIAKQNEEKLEALEIIKEKRVNVQALFYSTSCEDYNKHYTHYENLTQEEYDFLKEVLQ